jgi:hypothetical protein
MDDAGNRNNFFVAPKGDAAIDTIEAAKHLMDEATFPEIAKPAPHSAQNTSSAGSRGISSALSQDIADTAAEVAESAAIIDREMSPAPLSNDEAGRIGVRRLSSTPIEDVARTASEVADAAVILDSSTQVALTVSSPVIVD